MTINWPSDRFLVSFIDPVIHCQVFMEYASKIEEKLKLVLSPNW
jgi:hypothetical protein